MSSLMLLFILVGVVFVVIVGLRVLAQYKISQMSGVSVPSQWVRRWPDPVLVFITAPGCRACETERPKVSKIQAWVPVREVSVADAPDLIQALNLIATPTWIWVENGAVRRAWVGRLPLTRLRQWMQHRQPQEVSRER